VRSEPALWQQTATIRPCDGTIAWWPCAAGNCLVGRPYTDASGYLQAFVVSEFNSSEGRAIELAGSAALNARAEYRRVVAGRRSIQQSSPSSCFTWKLRHFLVWSRAGGITPSTALRLAKASHDEEELRELERIEPLLR